MAAEAAVRVQRRAGALSAAVKTVRDDVSELVAALDGVDPRLSRAVQAIETYREQMRSGGQLNERQQALYRNLTTYAENAATAPPIGMSAAAAMQRIGAPAMTSALVGRVHAYLSAAPPNMAAAAPPAAGPSSSGGSRALTAEERASYLQRGYTDEQLDRSRMLGGALLVRPPYRGAEPDSGPATPEADSDPVTPGTQTPQAAADDVEDASDQATEAIDRRTAAQQRLREQVDLSGLSEAQLRREWQRTQVDLRAQDRDLDRAIGQLDKLRDRRERGLLDDVGAIAEQRAKIGDLHAGRDTLWEHSEKVRAEAEARGYTAEDDRLVKPKPEPPSGLQRGLGAFVSGAGFGSGSMGGGLAGMALGTLSPATVIPALVGAAMVKGYKLAEDAYGKYVEQLQHTEPIGRTVGRTGAELYSDADRAARGYGVFSLPELYQGMQAAARTTGSPDLDALLPVASLTSQAPALVAQQQAGFLRMNPSLDPQLMARLFGEYEVSNTTRGGTALFGHFADTVSRTAGGMQQPLTRIPVEGVAAQLGGASYIDIPGIDMGGGGPIAADVAGEIVNGVNQWVGRPATGSGGALEDARLLGITRLRGTDLAERLKAELDIDIDTIPGALRAMERAPELAMRGFPEIAREMIGAERSLFGDSSLHEMALRRSGVGGEMAHFIATRDLENLYGVQPTGPALGLPERAAAAGMSGDAQRVFEWSIHPDLIAARQGESFADSGLVIGRNYNDFKESMTKTVAEGFAGLTDGVLGMLGAEVNRPAGVVPMDGGE